MKYGLLYYKDTDNIGDDIQTYAQKSFLPKIDYLIDREEIGLFIPNQKELVSVIMNAWYMHNKIAWPPSPFIKPLLISMHFTTNNRLNGEYSYLNDLGGQYLKENGPVGCRDNRTLELLKSHDIDSYFSGCMTLTIKPFKNLKKKDYICLVDVNDTIIEKVKKTTNRDVKIISHSLISTENSKLSIKKRMENVEELLKVYQQAHMVITTRLHAMLPTIALQTPVVLIRDEKYEDDRLGTFSNFVKNFSIQEFQKMDISEIIENPSQNSKDYLKIVKSLEKNVRTFTSDKSEEKKLPSLEEFKEIVKYKRYYLNLYKSCMEQSLKNIKEANFYYNEKEKRDRLIEKYKEDILIYKDKINNLQKSIDEKKAVY